MAMEFTVRTDASELHHHTSSKGFGHIDDAIRDAITRIDAPLWFWFNGTFAPVVAGDTAETLYARWEEWRLEYQRDPRMLLRRLEEWSLA